MKRRFDRRITGATAVIAALGLAASASAATTPTVSELLNAANCEYLINAVPAGMKAFTNNGTPVTFTDNTDGVVAAAFVTKENQVIIAFQGTTGGLNFLVDPEAAASQTITDLQIFLNDSLNGVIPGAYSVSLNFANSVVAMAEAQGFSTSNIFVTGHSLGGIEAEFVAQQTGLGGIGFEPTGLATKPVAGATGANFIDIVTGGDPVGNFSSDLQADQPLAPPFVAQGGTAPHYGMIVMIGSAADEATLRTDAQLFDTPAGDAAGLDATVTLLLDFHLPGTQAHLLNITLNPSAAAIDGLGIQNGPVFSVANDTIPQLIQAASSAGKLIQP